jgi:CPA2 family monovalent cation:H+ antiporter-2
METSTLIFEIGIVMLVSFIGAALATKAKQSVILGYILAGILIGPYISIQLFGLNYSGLVHDTSFIDTLSILGLTLLMFFVGLEFSFSKLKRTRSPAVILALINTGLDMFIGILIGYMLGWPIIDTVFLAGVFAMGSAAVTGKSLMEMKRMSAPETEFLLGAVIVEDFVSLVIMTVAGGLIFKNTASDPLSITQIIVGVMAFYVFFIFLALFVIPRTVKHLERIKSNEMFVLFALGMVFLSAALATVAGVPAIIGAFFLGMIFAETKLSERFEDRIAPFKDAFVAIFFVSFGMLIDPNMFAIVLPIIIIAIPFVILSDLILTGALAYLLGFSPKGATSMGASMCGRGAESVMFASIGSNSVGVTKAAIINPFAGLFCFIMSIITPALMRASDRTSYLLAKIVPSYVKHGSSLINRTIGKVMLPASLKLFKKTRRVEVALISYFVLLIFIMITSGMVQLVIFIGTVATTVYLYFLTEGEMRGIVKATSYDNLGVVTRDPRHISRFISSFIFVSLMTIVLTTFTFTYVWWSSVFVFTGFFISILLLMNHVTRRTRSPATNLVQLKEGPVHKDEKWTGRNGKRQAKKHQDAFSKFTPMPRSEVPLPPMDEDQVEPAPVDQDDVPEDDRDEKAVEKERWGRL